MDIKQERDLLQQLLEEGNIDSLSIQVIALNRFANSIGYKAVGGKIVERISLQYNKKLGKLTSELHWLKFTKEG